MAPIAVHPRPTPARRITVRALGAGVGGFVIAMFAVGAVNNLLAELATIIGAALGAGTASGAAATARSDEGRSEDPPTEPDQGS